MSVLGMNYNKIVAEKKNVSVKNINTTPKITDVKKTKLNGLGESKMDVLTIGFEYKTDYEPKAGEIRIIGNVIYSSDKVSEIETLWKKDKKLPAKVQVEIINYLFRTVSVKALGLSDLLKLPPVVSLPRLAFKKKE